MSYPQWLKDATDDEIAAVVTGKRRISDPETIHDHELAKIELTARRTAEILKLRSIDQLD